MKSDVYLSVVVTALNEENNVENCVRELSRFLDHQISRYEIIFVNDGSTDRTGERLDLLRETKNLKIIHLNKNIGTGGAIKSALNVIEGDWYCWLPSDLEILPVELLKPLALCEFSDVVVTSISNGALVRSEFRQFLSRFFVLLLNKSFGTRLCYFNGVSLVKTSLMKDLSFHSNRFFFHAELLLKVMQKTKKISEVPIVLTPRKADHSKAIKFKVLFDVAICYLVNVWQLRIKNENPHC